ncbi:hypothetical protein K503DRAFT_58592 [Rhizopogon vinicolor AM-OR11-026]|uniref:Uncharacterized protein n=1 Tax=Rhizopogon vinicolor AM-OR11-026 TaxID=1314800 RepID=A0A1B7N4E7_9AGAM|nr:hypothetical protein K503DRAFT_58592 [Rhizopogon vinicolor AM-OR11-026]
MQIYKFCSLSDLSRCLASGIFAPPTTPSLAVFVRSLVFFNISVSSLANTVFLVDLASNCPGSLSAKESFFAIASKRVSNPIKAH